MKSFQRHELFVGKRMQVFMAGNTFLERVESVNNPRMANLTVHQLVLGIVETGFEIAVADDPVDCIALPEQALHDLEFGFEVWRRMVRRLEQDGFIGDRIEMHRTGLRNITVRVVFLLEYILILFIENRGIDFRIGLAEKTVGKLNLKQQSFISFE